MWSGIVVNKDKVSTNCSILWHNMWIQDFISVLICIQITLNHDKLGFCIMSNAAPHHNSTSSKKFAMVYQIRIVSALPTTSPFAQSLICWLQTKL